MNRFVVALTAALGAGVGAAATSADEGQRHQGREHHHVAEDAGAASTSVNDARTLVRFPDALRIHTLANMRDHLQTMGAIQAALAERSFDKASELAEQRLGMSSMAMHGAHEVAKFMPPAMQDAGTAMHHAASQFALVARNASVTAELGPALAALAKVNESCVACHAAYRLQ